MEEIVAKEMRQRKKLWSEGLSLSLSVIFNPSRPWKKADKKEAMKEMTSRSGAHHTRLMGLGELLFLQNLYYSLYSTNFIS